MIDIKELEVKQDTFNSKIWKIGGSNVISIPFKILKKLKLSTGDIINVTIKIRSAPVTEVKNE